MLRPTTPLPPTCGRSAYASLGCCTPFSPSRALMSRSQPSPSFAPRSVRASRACTRSARTTAASAPSRPRRRRSSMAFSPSTRSVGRRRMRRATATGSSTARRARSHPSRCRPSSTPTRRSARSTSPCPSRRCRASTCRPPPWRASAHALAPLPTILICRHSNSRTTRTSYRVLDSTTTLLTNGNRFQSSGSVATAPTMSLLLSPCSTRASSLPKPECPPPEQGVI
mmetsp:Transcript_10192/g.22115  ORF Transcript_10192/g.22115 Transcript_10192/m.22115 type:complete len:226 (-) Transcript_10192:768-1445(-)